MLTADLRERQVVSAAGGGDCTTIAEALAAAAPGGLIVVRPRGGEQLELRGCAITGGATAGVVLDVAGATVLLEDVTIAAGGVGAAVLGGAPTLRGCTIHGGGTGLHFSGEDTAGLVEKCALEGNGTGL